MVLLAGVPDGGDAVTDVVAAPWILPAGRPPVTEGPVFAH